MVNDTTRLLREVKKSNAENKKLRQQLEDARSFIDSIKGGGIDALVNSKKESLQIYTETTADKAYRTLIEKMHEGAVTIDKGGTILFCNSHFAFMAKLPLQKVVGKNFNDFIDESSKTYVKNLQLTRRKTAARKEGRLYSGKASTPVLISANQLVVNKSILLNIILTDLTLQQKNQKQLTNRTNQLEAKNTELEIANKELTAFTYLSSHDLQEPLRKIQNFIDLLLDEETEKLSTGGKDYLQRTKETATQMRELIDDLSTYARTKNTDRKFEKTNLSVMLDEVRSNLSEAISEKKATIEDALECDAKIIQFQFRQLLYNLISNSLKFSKTTTAPQIVIKSEILRGNKLNNKKLLPMKSYCHITYTDNGIGFSPRYEERIFDVFQRLHSKKEYPGTGIGLAICKRVVENHKGFITATGRLDEGAQFDIYFPVS